MSDAPIRVLLVDDHAVVRAGYRHLLARDGRIQVVGEAADAQAAYVAYCELAPDVVVMDIALPGASGIEAVRRIVARDDRARVLMFSMYEDAIFAARALQAGARGYLTKRSGPDALVEAVLALARGERYFGREVAQALALRSTVTPREIAGDLSVREFEILQMLVGGTPLNEIASRLRLSEKTVANYQSTIKQKLGVSNAIQLMHKALQLGLVSGHLAVGAQPGG
ncbi:MAG TPA: response regulator transcription factor [Burkholderiaceae bacterium]|jgi:DNA-binding NarL/FixJ family response regulator|nr:response regulator transcription factor [Burkholderiaceae bacterium]